MRYLFLAFSFLASVNFACATTSPERRRSAETDSGNPQGCPVATLGEQAEDCPWAGVARALIAESDSGQPVLPKLKQLLPDLVAQIRTDSERTYLKYLWGKSINFDEFANGVIVHPAILESLGELMGENGTGRVVHAGMEHTYGYLFSVLKTSFGYKRARWVRPTLEEGLEVGGQALSPLPPEGTFFSNITYFMSQIAFHNDAKALEGLRNSARQAPLFATAVVSYPYASLPLTRLEETLRIAGDDPDHPRTVILRTDFVPFKKVPAGQSNSHLLVYSVYDSSVGTPQLVTGFPVEASFVERALKKEHLGQDQPIQTRYNAYVEGVTGKSLKGERRVIATRSLLRRDHR